MSFSREQPWIEKASDIGTSQCTLYKQNGAKWNYFCYGRLNPWLFSTMSQGDSSFCSDCRWNHVWGTGGAVRVPSPAWLCWPDKSNTAWSITRSMWPSKNHQISYSRCNSGKLRKTEGRHCKLPWSSLWYDSVNELKQERGTSRNCRACTRRRVPRVLSTFP